MPPIWAFSGFRLPHSWPDPPHQLAALSFVELRNLAKGVFFQRKGATKPKHLGYLDSKKSSTGPTERTPKPEDLIALATYLGVRW